MTRKRCRHDQIIDMLNDGYTYRDIADCFGTDKATIAVYDKERTGTLTAPGSLISEVSDMPDEANEDMGVVELYKTGMTVADIARLKHMNRENVAAHLYMAGIDPKGHKALTDDMIAEIVDRYSRGEGFVRIGHDMHVNIFLVKLALDKLGVQRPEISTAREMTELDWATVIDLYVDKGMKLTEIARQFHTSSTRLSEYLKSKGIPLRYGRVGRRRKKGDG